MVEPIKNIKVGQIQVAIWSNPPTATRNFPTKSITITKRYMDKQGNWQDSKSYNVNDIAKLRLAIEEAQRFILLGNQGENEVFGKTQGEGGEKAPSSLLPAKPEMTEKEAKVLQELEPHRGTSAYTEEAIEASFTARLGNIPKDRLKFLVTEALK